MKTNKLQKISYVVIAMAALIAGSASAAGELRVPGLTIGGQPSQSFAESFKLYREAGFVPDSECDVHTALDLDVAQLNGKVAILEERVTGSCEIAVFANTRIYRLSREDAGCGSTLYKGTVATSEGVNTIEILDHRNRRCRDLVPARVIVTETRNGSENTLYSANLVVQPHADRAQ